VARQWQDWPSWYASISAQLQGNGGYSGPNDPQLIRDIASFALTGAPGRYRPPGFVGGPWEALFKTVYIDEAKYPPQAVIDYYQRQGGFWVEFADDGGFLSQLNEFAGPGSGLFFIATAAAAGAGITAALSPAAAAGASEAGVAVSASAPSSTAAAAISDAAVTDAAFSSGVLGPSTMPAASALTAEGAAALNLPTIGSQIAAEAAADAALSSAVTGSAVLADSPVSTVLDSAGSSLVPQMPPATPIEEALSVDELATQAQTSAQMLTNGELSTVTVSEALSVGMKIKSAIALLSNPKTPSAEAARARLVAANNRLSAATEHARTQAPGIFDGVQFGGQALALTAITGGAVVALILGVLGHVPQR
jgi:hypothetical protein